MKSKKLLLYLLAGALIGVVGLAVYLVATFDAARLKSEIEQAVEQKTGRRITVGEPVGLSLFPDLAIALGGVRLSEPGQPAQQFAAIEKARVSVRLLPLLSKRIEAQQVELVGLTMRIVVDKDGRRNIDDLLAAPAPPESPPAIAAPAPRFNVADLRILKSAVTYVDEAAARSFAFSDFALETGVLANQAADRFSTSGKLAAAGGLATFEAQGDYRLDTDAGSYSAEALRVELRGDLAGINGLDAGLNVAALAWQAAPGLRIDKLALTAKGKTAGASVEATADIPKLIVGQQAVDAETIRLQARMLGPEGPLTLALHADGVQGTAQAPRSDRLVLTVEGRRGETALNGRLSAVLAASVADRTVDLTRLAGDFELRNPAMPAKAAKLGLGGRLRADWGRRTAAGETTLRLDDSTIESRWEVTRLAPLVIGFDLVADRLDLDRYRPSAPAGAPPAAGAVKPAAGGEAMIDLTALRRFDARGRLRIGALQAANLKFADFRSNLRVRGGRLELDDLSARLYDGRLGGSAALDSRDNRLTVRQTLESVNINPLLRDALGKDVLEGRGSLSLDIVSSGATVAALKRGLNGSATIALRDGAIKGIDLARSFRQLKARLGARQDVAQRASAADKTDFTELNASFRITNGVAHNDDLTAKSPFLRLAGAGDIRLGESSIDYRARVSVVNTSGGQAGKDLADLRGMTIPVRLSGPFDDVSYKIEFSAVIAEAVKAQVREKVEKKVQEKLGERLKGLFGK